MITTTPECLGSTFLFQPPTSTPLSQSVALWLYLDGERRMAHRLLLPQTHNVVRTPSYFNSIARLKSADIHETVRYRLITRSPH